jgi:hypothetical protein
MVAQTLARYADFETVLRELIPLMMALTAAAIVYVARERRRRRMRIRPLRPRIRMREVSGSPALLELERVCLASDHPRVAFRRAALESAVEDLYLEAIQAQRSDAPAWPALREYLRLKYDDAVAGDWFDHFMDVARPYIRERVRLSQESADGFARIYDELLYELINEALSAPQKKSFVPPDFSHS